MQSIIQRAKKGAKEVIRKVVKMPSDSDDSDTEEEHDEAFDLARSKRIKSQEKEPEKGISLTHLEKEEVARAAEAQQVGVVV